jgi:hypothetical protein
MAFVAKSVFSLSVNSGDTGRQLGEGLRAGLGDAACAAVLVHASVQHDQPALLAGLREAGPPGARVLGCSSQGLMARGATVEGGYFAGALALGGDVMAGVARADDIHLEPRAKGRALGDALRAQVPGPRLVLVYFDPLAGADVSALLAGLHERLPGAIAGGAASQPWGSMVTTYQYEGREVFSRGAVAVALAGAFTVELAASHGTEPIGLERTITRAEGNRLLELDGERAADVWKDAIGTATVEVTQMAALAIGLPNRDLPELGAYRVLSPALVNHEDGSVLLFTPVEPGTRVMLHSRTVAHVLEGTRTMARDLAARLAGRKVAAVLGFECGARTEPFLGREATRAENLELQERLAPDAAWLGMMAWGEVLALQGGPAVVNYTFPLVCLVAS